MAPHKSKKKYFGTSCNIVGFVKKTSPLSHINIPKRKPNTMYVKTKTVTTVLFFCKLNKSTATKPNQTTRNVQPHIEMA